MAATYSKTVILTMIKEKKGILFGSLPHPLTNEDRHKAWKEVCEKAKSLGILKPDKSWEYVRDVSWANWKRRTLEKRDNKRKTGTGGGRPVQYTELDNLVLDIIGRETPIVEGLQVPESMAKDIDDDFELLSPHDSPIRVTVSPMASTSTEVRAPAKSAAKPKEKPKVMWKVNGMSTTSKSAPDAKSMSTTPPPPSKSTSFHGRGREGLKRPINGSGSEQASKKAQLQLDLMEIDKRTKAIQLYKLEKKFNLPASEFTLEFHDAIMQQEEVEEQ